MNKKTSYYVWNPANRPPMFAHPTREAAEKEAERLAKLNPGEEFVVLRSIASVQHTSVTWTNHVIKTKEEYNDKHDSPPF